MELPIAEIRNGVQRIDDTLALFRVRPPLPALPQTPADQRRILGGAEIELALGHKDRALQLLMGRLSDPKFQELPEHVATLLMTSEILEHADEDVGAMHYAEQALVAGGTPEQMAEAGARWFRLARRHQRLDRRLELYQLWKSRGGEAAGGSALASSVMYEAGFALRADGDFAQARAFLARVPSDSAFGARAAYLAGAVFVEEGDLANAERWFAAIMDWPLPALQDSHPQLAIERRVRELAALSSARLRYERGDLPGADEAYRRIADDSPLAAESCWERAYLDLERERRRGALKRVQCVVDIGARGGRYVDAQLFQASLLAHLEQYADSIVRYEALHANMVEQRDLYSETLRSVMRPSEMLFAAMERNAMTQGADASPGPATLFGDAWTPEVGRAYRVDRGLVEAGTELGTLVNEIDAITATLQSDRAFIGIELRRKNLEVILREIHHFEGHAGENRMSIMRRHASNGPIAAPHDHAKDAAELDALVQSLRGLARQVEQDMLALDREEATRRTQALSLLGEIRSEVLGIMKDVGEVKGEASVTVDAVARAALEEVETALTGAAMRAEFGVLDTYWLKKQHRTRDIERLLDMKKETERQVVEAMRDLEEKD